jgi:hypothetical protein
MADPTFEPLRRALTEDHFPDSEEFFDSSPFARVVPDRLKFERNVAVSAWIDRQTGQPTDFGAPDWQAAKDATAQGFFKQTKKNVSDEEIHSLVRTHVQTADEATREGWRAGMAGKPQIAALQAFDAKRGPSLVRAKWDEYNREFQGKYAEASRKRAQYAGLIDDAAGAIQTEGESNLPPGTSNLQSIADRLLSEVPEDDRRFVIAAIGATAAEAPDEQRSFLGKLAAGFNRALEAQGAGAESIVSSFLSGSAQAGLAEQGYPQDIQEGVKAEGDKKRELYLLSNLVRKTIDEGVPVETEGWQAESTLGLARNAPMTIAAFVPVVGWGSMAGTLRDDAATDLLQQNPGMSIGDADAIATAATPLLTATEFVANRIPFGKIPLVGKLLNQGMTSWKSALIRGVGARIGLGTAGEVGEEVIQNRIPLYLQELSAAMDKEMPGVDWYERNKELAKLPGEVFGPALLMSIVGGGGSSIKDMRDGRTLAMDRDLMVATGSSPALAEEIATAAEAGNWQQVDALLARTVKATGSDAATPEQRLAAATTIAQREQKAAEDEQRDMREAGVNIRKVAEGWEVSSLNDGSAVKLPSHDEAMTVVRSQLAAQSIQKDEATLEAFAAFSKQAPEGQEFQISNRVATLFDLENEAKGKGDQDTVDAIWQRVEMERQKTGNQELGPGDFSVLGQSLTDFREGVKTYVSRINEGSRAVDLVEEKAESDLRRWIDTGRMTIAKMAEMIRAVEAATGDKYLADDGEVSVYEAYSDITRLWATGTRKGNQVSGAVRGQEARIMRQQRTRLRGLENKGVADSLIQSIKEAVEFFKAVLKQAARLMKAKKGGKLGDIEQFLNESVGLTAEAEHVAGVEKEVAKIGGTFSLRRVNKIDPETGLTLNSDGTVTVYHGTTKEAAKKIRATGVIKSAGEPDVYFTTAKDGTGYGDGTVVAVNIDPSKLQLDDEFPDGRKDFRVEVGSAKALKVKFPDTQSYSLTTSARLEAISKALGEQVKQKPKERRDLAAKAQARLLEAQREWEALPEARTLADIEREAKAREGFAYDEFLRDQFQADTPEKQKAVPQFGRDAARKEAKAEAEKWQKAEIAKTASEGAAKKRQQAAMRTLDAVLSVLPASERSKVGGFIKLAELGSDEARVKEIESRFARVGELLEGYFHKQFRQEIKDLFDKARAKSESGEKAEGKLGPEAHAWFDEAERVAGLAPTKIDEELDALEVKETRDLTAEEMAELSAWIGSEITEEDAARELLEERRNILETFGSALWGGTRGDNINPRTAAELSNAFELAEQRYQDGRAQWFLDRIAQKAERDGIRNRVIGTIGGLGTDDERRVNAVKKRKSKGSATLDYLDQGFSFSGFLSDLLGNSTVFYRLRNTARKSMLTEKANIRARQSAFDSMMKNVLGGSLRENQRKLAKLAAIEETSPVGSMSQLQALQYTLWFRDPASQAWLENHGYGAKWQENAEAWLTPEAKQIRSWLEEQYEGQYFRINKVFRKLRGVNLPKVARYGGPRLVANSSTADTDISLTPDGMAGAMTQGFLKKRIAIPSGPPRAIDALTNYWNNAFTVEHYIAWGESARELRGVLGHRDTKLALEANRGVEKAKQVSQWVEDLTAGGTRNAIMNTLAGEFMNRQGRAVSAVALLGKVSVLLKQIPAMLGSAFKIGLGEYSKGLARVMAGQGAKSLSEMWDSAPIQNRVANYSPLMRQAMEGAMSKMAPDGMAVFLNDTQNIETVLWEAIGFTDAVFTTVSGAIAYDSYYRQGLKLGMNEEEARAFAEIEAANTIGETAQPDNVLDKSLFENRVGNPWLRLIFAFQSANRQAFGLVLEAYKNGTWAQKANATAIAFFIIPTITQTMANLIRYATSDDDWEDVWELEDYRNAWLMGPLTGALQLGPMLEAIPAIFGKRVESRIAQAPTTMLVNVGREIVEGDWDTRDIGSGMTAIATLLGGRATALGVSWNVLKQLLGFADAVTEGDQETVSKAQK